MGTSVPATNRKGLALLDLNVKEGAQALKKWNWVECNVLNNGTMAYAGKYYPRHIKKSSIVERIPQETFWFDAFREALNFVLFLRNLLMCSNRLSRLS